MGIHLINASLWQCFEDEDKVRYVADEDEDCFRGFAWLEFNKKTQKIIAARDNFGQEPFYYARHGHKFIFGSFLQDILNYLPTMPIFTSHMIRDCFMRYPADDPIDDPPYVTETYYKGVFRVTPGHYLHVTPDKTYEEAFWALDPEKPKIYYADSRDYVKHFEYLLNEALTVSTKNLTNLAMEFSGGIDSTMLFIASRNLNLETTLFTHIPPKSRQPTSEDKNVKYIIDKYNWTSKHVSVDSEKFDPISIFTKFSKVLSGPSPNLNCLLSNNLHDKILQKGMRFVLTGYGGDDCVSLIFPPEIGNNPEKLYKYEAQLLQGQYCHEIRMRLEYSSVVTKYLGLKYIYPLLYPPLIEYCFSLPIEQKLMNGAMRCTAKKYLLKYLNEMQFSTKTGAVVPSTMQKCRDYYRLGKFADYFIDLPFQEYISARNTDDDKLLLMINAYMIKPYCIVSDSKAISISHGPCLFKFFRDLSI